MSIIKSLYFNKEAREPSDEKIGYPHRTHRSKKARIMNWGLFKKKRIFERLKEIKREKHAGKWHHRDIDM